MIVCFLLRLSMRTFERTATGAAPALTFTVSRSPVLEASSSCRSTSELPTTTPSAETDAVRTVQPSRQKVASGSCSFRLAHPAASPACSRWPAAMATPPAATAAAGRRRRSAAAGRSAGGRSGRPGAAPSGPGGRPRSPGTVGGEGWGGSSQSEEEELLASRTCLSLF